MLLAMVAPRGLMMYSGYAESAANPLGFEQAYRSALRGLPPLGREQNIWLHLREGEHPTSAADIENFVDFYDAVFGRGKRPKSETWIFGYEFDSWLKRTGERIDPLKFPERTPGNLATAGRSASRKIRQAIRSMLGAEPPRLPFAGKRKLSDGATSSESWLATLYNRPTSDRQWAGSLAAPPAWESRQCRSATAGRPTLLSGGCGRQTQAGQVARGRVAASVCLFDGLVGALALERFHGRLPGRPGAFVRRPGQPRLCRAGLRPDRLRHAPARIPAVLRALPWLVVDGPHGGRRARRRGCAREARGN